MKPPTLGDSGLGIVFPEKISLEINKWRRIYDPNCDVILPHITVAFPFVPKNEMPLIRPILVKCLKEFRPFNITLRDLNFFSGEQYVLWLKPDDNGILVRIRNALEEKLPEYVSPSLSGYIPHLTIGYFESQEALVKAKESIRLQLKPIQFTVIELLYCVLDENNKLNTHDRFTL